MSRYSFYSDSGKNVICVSHYAGKPVRAAAKCHPNDEYDYAAGCRLAQARVDAKIAKKRQDRARMKFNEAFAAFEEAKDYLSEMQEYFSDAIQAADAANANLMKIEEEI